MVEITKEQVLTAEDGQRYKVALTYSLDSGIPANAELQVSELREGSEYDQYVKKSAKKLGKKAKNLDLARAFDISLVDPATGKHYQPDQNVRVRVQLLDEDLSRYEQVKVVHFPGKADGKAEVMDSSIQGKSVEFDTDGFSVYVITGDGTDTSNHGTPRRTYIFYTLTDTGSEYSEYFFTLDNGESTTNRQTVKDGEYPQVPNPASESGKEFAGWYEKKSDNSGAYEDQPYNFNTPVTQNEVVELYAVFKSYVKVIFHDQFNSDSGLFPIAESRRFVPTEGAQTLHVKISDASATYSGTGEMTFTGWSTTSITVPGSPQDDDNKPVEAVPQDANGYADLTIPQSGGEIHLYPIYKPIKWLSFWSGLVGSGATYLPSVKCIEGRYPFDSANPDHLPVPERTGYTFKGWYAGTINAQETVTYTSPLTTAEGYLIGSAADGGMQVRADTSGYYLYLSQDATLYAMWEGADSTTYKVLIWKQKSSAAANTPAAQKYELYESFSETAAIGSAASVKAEYTQYDTSKPTEFSGYTCTYDPAVNPVDKDGKTVLNVYYDRTGDYTPSTTSEHTLTFKSAADDSEVYSTEQNVAYQTDLSNLVPEDPTRDHYDFTGWYADRLCTTRVFFSQSERDAYTGSSPTVLYDKMPDRNLDIYAGWEAVWYLVELDPNYGEYHGTESTWTWKTVESDLIQEYTNVTRDYVESSSGKYYYVKHDRNYYGFSGVDWYASESGTDRRAFYTTKPGTATDYKTFERADGVYSYAGWYEVLSDGTEVPYDFSKPVDHHTHLKLHWKKAGNYYLRYLSGDGGTLEDGSTEYDDPTTYADNARITLTRSATPNTALNGNQNTFIGWKIKGDRSGTVYGMGKSLLIQSDYAQSINGKETITLEAVYIQLGTVSLTYNFNGGTFDPTVVAGGEFDYGSPTETGAPVPHTSMGNNSGPAKVENLIDNSDFTLSNGAGLTRNGFTLKGWSNRSVYDENDPEAQFYRLNHKHGVDSKLPDTIYAVWGTKVIYHLNVPDVESAADFSWSADVSLWSGYDLETNSREQVYTKTAYLGTPVTQPSAVPQNNGSSAKMFRFWTADTTSNNPYDFSQPVTGELHLYAYWSDPVQIPVHAVDASAETLADKDTNWVTGSSTTLPVGKDEVDLSDVAEARKYMTDAFQSRLDSGEYVFAFAAAHNKTTPVTTLTESEKITKVYYNASEKHVFAAFADGHDSALTENEDEIYFVFYAKKTLPISYKTMPSDGGLSTPTNLNTNAAPAALSASSTGEYDMTSTVTTPLNYVTGSSYSHYSFAIGTTNAADASNLSLITTAADSDSNRPNLKLKNTWRGFAYSEDDGQTWTPCGYEPTLYVVYFEQQPTVIMFTEKTLGTKSVLETPFTYDLEVTATTSTSVQKQKKVSEDVWVNEGTPTVTPGTPAPVYGPDSLNYSPYVLKHGEANSAILFYSSDAPTYGAEYTENGDIFRDETTTTTAQSAKITQTANAGFQTKVSVDGGTESETLEYSYTSDGSGGVKKVTFTNRANPKEVEVHVVRIENGALKLRDLLRSSSAPQTYHLNLAVGQKASLPDDLPASGVYSDSDGIYAFGAVVYGSDEGSGEGSTVTAIGMGVQSVSYGKVKDNQFELLIKDADGSKHELGSNKLYYLYYPMPVVQYVKQDGTTLKLVKGSTDGTTEVDDITYGRTKAPQFQMNGKDVVQNQRLELSRSGLHISQKTGVNYFNMPPILDDGLYQRYLSFSGLSVGSAISQNQSVAVTDTGDHQEMRLKIEDNQLKYSYDGEQWTDLGDQQVIYAIYTERGYDLRLTKKVDTAQSGNNALFTGKSFTVTIQPKSGTDTQFKKQKYPIEGYSTEEVSVQDGKITLTVKDGTRVRLRKLSHGTYTITESDNDNFKLTPAYGSIVDTPTPVPDSQIQNSSFDLPLTEEMQVLLTNQPKPLCEVVVGTQEDGVVCYTMQSAIDYITNNIADGTATIAMLSDYLMPASDTLNIPSNAHITLTTAAKGTNHYTPKNKTASIFRGADMVSDSIITNEGELTLKNITLDGKSLDSTTAMVHSIGTLTVDRGTKIWNAKNPQGNGGAIYAKGAVTFGGNDNAVALSNNQAKKGGLLYYDGDGSVTLSNEFSGSISGNSAACGGAIYAVGGSVTVSGGTLSGNTAAGGDGGALYSENARLILSGGTFSGNTATSSGGNGGKGGAVYANIGAVSISGSASLTGNTAASKGGAVCANSGAVSISGSGSLSGNTATNGNGGAVYADNGDVTIEAGTISGNRAPKGSGGAVYASTGVVSMSGGTIGGDSDSDANQAKSGGGIYSDSGTVIISGSAILTGNKATTDNGGALCTDSGSITIENGSLTKNSAVNGNGGAVYANSGSIAMSGGTIGGDSDDTANPDKNANRAQNGGAVYINTGSADFSGSAKVTHNSGTASPSGDPQGGAVGVGDDSARLTFSGTVQIQDNKTGTVACNVFLNQDTSAVINASGLISGAYVGIYCPGTDTSSIFAKRGSIGKEFGTYLGSDSPATIDQIHNDRESNLKAVVNSTTKRIYWSSQINVQIRYLQNYSNKLPDGGDGSNSDQSVKVYPDGTSYVKKYYPLAGNASLSLLADELHGNCNSSLPSSAVYATTLLGTKINNTLTHEDYSKYLTNLLWEDGQWKVERRDGSKKALTSNDRLVIYYSEPAFLSIENNTAFDLNISDLHVTMSSTNMSLLNSTSDVGYSLIFARDGEIQEGLLPAEKDANGNLKLQGSTATTPGGSITLLLPGLCGLDFTLGGLFNGGTHTLVRQRNGTQDTNIYADDTVNVTGTTPADGKTTYEIIFGEDKEICKIECPKQTGAAASEYVRKTTADANGKVEYTFSKIQKAVDFAKSHSLSSVTIEMLVDYLMPGSDVATVSTSTDGITSLTLTTARTGTYHYPGTETDPTLRATISRGTGNESPLVSVTGNVGTAGDDSETTFTVQDIQFDGKNIVGECEGGAVFTQDCKVTMTNADFANCVSCNGGAVFVSYGSASAAKKKETKKYRFSSSYNSTNAVFTVSNCKFRSCEAQYIFGRSGGGAIWTNAKIFTVNTCDFTLCKSTGNNMQGGAVFHRIEATDKLGNNTRTPYYAESETHCTDCTFTGCEAQAGGAMESDATGIWLDNCTFTGCKTTVKDGGTLNVYIYEQDSKMNYNSIPSELHMTGCTIIGSNATRNGGAVRSMAVDNEFVDCTFTNTIATGNGKGGGAIYVSNNRSNTTTVKGCSFTGAVSNNGPGGAICTYSKELVVTGSDNNSTTKITGCQAQSKDGGAIYHYVFEKSYAGNSNAVGAFTSINDCQITGCTAKKNGGAVYTNAKNARKRSANAHSGDTDINATASSEDEAIKLLTNSTIQNCKAETEKGGGIYLAESMAYATIEGSEINGCTAKTEGGGLWSKVNDLSVTSSTFSGCTSGTKGGGIFHSQSGSQCSFTDCTIENCKAQTSGGGFFTDNASSLEFIGSTIQNNEAVSNDGGGIYNNTSATFTLKNTTVSGNKAAGKGGGVYTKKFLKLIQTIITGNTLTSAIQEDGAGVYMKDENNNLLEVGAVKDANASEEERKAKDYSAVMNNFASGKPSNLRMPVQSNGENKNCVKVYCNLGEVNGKGGYIGVVNAWKIGTRFGSNETQSTTVQGLEDPDGTVELNAVFNGDTNTLYGIISRTDDSRKQIVWAGPPVCKITDQNGKLLYFKKTAADPAIFDVLEDGTNVVTGGISSGKTSAFSLLRNVMTHGSNAIKLYYAPDGDNQQGARYEGTTFCVKMLVKEYELTNQITTVDKDEYTIILTTAGKNDTDNYPYERSGGDQATIYRGSGVTGSMVKATTNMEFKNICLNGNSVALTNNGRILSVEGSNDIQVKMSSNAVFEFGKAANGGAVSVTNGSFTLNGGLIRWCDATNNGGAVYVDYNANGSSDPVYANYDNNTSSQLKKCFNLTAGTIQGCNAQNNGGGVYVNNGIFDMSGGFIYGCSASNSGGGVYVENNKAMYMSGGKIGGDAANGNHAAEHGGGIAVGGDQAYLHFSHQVNVTKNTCDAAESGKFCNLELDRDSNAIINTEGLWGRSNIGVYVPGDRDDLHPENDNSFYKDHGGFGDPFGTYKRSSAQLHCFINDRNGLKGGLIANPAPNTIYWIKIFSIEVSKEVDISENVVKPIADDIKDDIFTFTVKLRDTSSNVSGVYVKDIADDIQNAHQRGEESKYGEILFELDSTDSTNQTIIATIHLKDDDEPITATNLPDGLEYEVVETPTPRYVDVPDQNKPLYRKSGSTGENKESTQSGVDPYVSQVKFTNLLPVCKITDADGKLLYKTEKSGSDDQTPAVYKDLSEAIAVVNGEYGKNVYEAGSTLSYTGDLNIEMLVPEYQLTGQLTLSSSKKVTITTASTSVTSQDIYPFNGYDSGRTVSAIQRKNTFANGSMITMSTNSDLTLTNIMLDGKEVVTTVDKGGLVYVRSNAALTVTDGAELTNSRITGDGDGAGVYLEAGANLYLSGTPKFGGTDTDFDYLENATGNFKLDELTGKQNGGKIYTVAHQDIYLAESRDGDPASITLTGDLIGDEGSIWVWANSDYHKKQLMPFARIADGVSFVETKDVDESNYKFDAAHLKVFRNAQPDDDSENGTDTYLFGVTNEEDQGKAIHYVYWTGVSGARKVILRKLRSDNQSLDGAVLTVYRGNSSDPYVVKTKVGSTVIEDELKDKPSESDGVFWIGVLPYGTYCLHETTVPGSVKQNGAEGWWYTLTVSATEITCSGQQASRPTT